jgi:hypothetical protein
MEQAFKSASAKGLSICKKHVNSTSDCEVIAGLLLSIQEEPDEAVNPM